MMMRFVCFVPAALLAAVVLSGCAAEGVQPPPAQTAGATAGFEDPPVGTLIRRKKAPAAGADVGRVDPQALDQLRNMDNGSMSGK